jgi:hypothetical protein
VTGTIESTTGFTGIQESDVPTLSAYATTSALSTGLGTKQDSGSYATTSALSTGLATKQDSGSYAALDADGNLGLGVTPDAKLHVNGKTILGNVGAYGGTHTDALLTLGQTHNTGYNLSNKVKLLISGGDNDGSSPYYIFCEDENGHDQFFVKGGITSTGTGGIMYFNGNVGIGDTTPSSKLDVNGSIRGAYNANTTSYFGRSAIGYCGHSDYCAVSHIDRNNTSDYALLQSSTGFTYLNCKSDQGITFRSGNSDKMRMTSTGSFGIATTSPALGFHVNVQYSILGKTNTQSGIIYNDIGTAKWRVKTGGYHLNFDRHSSSSSSNYTSFTSRGYLASNGSNVRLNFTGQHRTFITDVPFTEAKSKEGLIVSANRDTYIKMSDGVAYGAKAITINECLPIVTLSQKTRDKTCFGVISLSEDPETREEAFGVFVSVFDKEKGDTRIFVNSVGEGGIWVVNMNDVLESGDYITTSNIPGYGMKQNDDLLHNYTVAKITMNCDFNPTLQKVKRIKKKMSEVKYWVNISNLTVTKEEYDELQPEFRRIIQDENENDVYQTDDKTEWTRDPVEEGVETFTEIRNELQNDLDEHDQIQWEDTDETEKAYKIRFLLPDSTQISEEEYTTRVLANEEVYLAAFVGCTYHCG